MLIATEFNCVQCGKRILTNSNSMSTGYAYAVDALGRVSEENKICYACCAKQNRQWMLEHDRITLYLVQIENPRYPIARHQRRGTRAVTASDWKIVNWPNSLEFNVTSIRLGNHNIAGNRLDVWFIGPDGYEWHGIQLGDNSQLVRCKRTKNCPHYVDKVSLSRGLK